MLQGVTAIQQVAREIRATAIAFLIPYGRPRILMRVKRSCRHPPGRMQGLASGTGGERLMSSYARYCRDQAAECARRARLARSPEIVERCRRLGLQWLKLAQKAEAGSRSTNVFVQRPPAPNASPQPTA